MPLPPLKRKIHPLLRPILPKRKKPTVVSSTNNSNNNKTIILLPPPRHYLLLYQYCFTKRLVRAIFGEEKRDIELDISKETIKGIKKWLKMNKISIFSVVIYF